MRLEYKILWFEDDENWVKKEIGPTIEKYLWDDMGFTPTLVHKKDGSDIDNLVAQGNFDLIVSDLNLSEDRNEKDETGRKIIANLRNHNILTEVLLYSSDTERIKEIKDSEPGVERASFAAGREFLPIKMREIILLTIKKVQDVNNMRGLVIAEAIDLEMRVRTILLDHFRNHGDSGKIKKLKEEHVERITTNLEKINGYDEKRIPEFIDEVLSFSDINDSLLSLVNDLLAEVNAQINGAKRDNPIHEKKRQLDELRKGLITMKEELILLRNNMAHAKEFKDANGKSFLKSIQKGRGDVTFSDADCVEMRKNIFKHLQNIEAIAKHLI